MACPPSEKVKKMRYTVEVNFLGDIEDAPEFWWRDTFERAGQQIKEKKKTSGKVFLYKDDKVYQATWELKEEF